ncbi:hypothetical protein BS50DRAFT_639754 [Corynespora cassiicola Philippines]|uniref:Uncharacterized protein n=1 Tax=Corynespora cassiicola Philippines TaxID=1448308 RepID=A0A2T2N6R3_CORCC|nr:hypothetical protein BS50DRAFT_639754 [Corynespora cassiicola Philippines]
MGTVCAVLTGLFGIFRAVRPFDQRSPSRRESSSRAERLQFYLMVLLFTFLPLAFSTFLLVWQIEADRRFFFLAFELSWLNGLFIELFIFWNLITSIPYHRRAIGIIGVTICLVQIGGCIAYNRRSIAGRILFGITGARLTYIFAAPVVTATFSKAWLRAPKFLAFELTYLGGAIGDIVIAVLELGDRIFLVHCIIECIVIFVLVIIQTHKKGAIEPSAQVVDVDEPTIHEDALPWVIEIQTDTCIIITERNGLITPPYTPTETADPISSPENDSASSFQRRRRLSLDSLAPAVQEYVHCVPDIGHPQAAQPLDQGRYIIGDGEPIDIEEAWDKIREKLHE